jgi:hypothetical protein
MRTISGTLYVLCSSGPVGNSGGYGVERSNQKGGNMNQTSLQAYSLGMFHGGLIIGFVWIMFKSIGKK